MADRDQHLPLRHVACSAVAYLSGIVGCGKSAEISGITERGSGITGGDRKRYDKLGEAALLVAARVATDG